MISLQIFSVFFRISFLSFGGVFGSLPELERMIVGEHAWISHERFLQSYVMAQFVPGPNMAMCPLIGYWVNGWMGFLAGFLGIYAAPALLMGLTYVFMRKYGKFLVIRRLEKSFRPIVLGLMTASALRVWFSQSPGIVGPTQGIPLWSQIWALVLTLLGVYYLVKKWLGPMKVIFLSGSLWWLFHWLIPKMIAR